MYKVIANYIYEVINTTLQNGLPDWTIGLAYLRADKDIPDGISDAELRKWFAKHEKFLFRMYASNDKDLFVETVVEMLTPDEEANADV